jgi:hypothetical protein
MAPNNQQFEIEIYFPDTTYGRADDSLEEWQVKSAALKGEIERECGLQLEDADIAPGSSYPAFQAIITDYWPLAAVPIAVFLAGGNIEKNLEAWPRIYKRLKGLLVRPAYLDKNGASVLAMNAVIEECGKAPETTQLEGYALWLSLEGKVEYDVKPIVGVADSPEAKYLAVIVHIFQIAADDRRFKVYVEANDTHLVELPAGEILSARRVRTGEH